MNRFRLKNYFLPLLVTLLTITFLKAQDCNCTDLPAKAYVIDNMKRSEIPQSVFSSNSTFYITGTFSIDGYLSLSNKTLIMGPRASIVVETARSGNINLQLTNCTLKGCGCMWEGITVNKRGILTFSNNNIQDAYHAIYVKGGQIISDKAQLQNVIGNVFDKNYISIWAEDFFTITNIPYQGTPPYLVGNTFTCTGPLAKGYFQDGFRDCIGFYAYNAREVIQIGKSQQSQKKYPPNIFTNLYQGVYISQCDSSLIVIENNQFKNISNAGILLFDNADIPSQVFNNTFDNTVIGVSVETAPAIVRNNTFENIHIDSLGTGGYGIYLSNSSYEAYSNKLNHIDNAIKINGSSKVYNNELVDVNFGIEVSPNPKDFVAVYENKIQCQSNGITLYNPSSAYNIDIHHNNINLDNKGKNVSPDGSSTLTSGFWVDGFYDKINAPSYTGASIHDNNLNIIQGEYGFYINVSKNILYQNNNIYTKNGNHSGSSAISLSGSYGNSFIKNTLLLDTTGLIDMSNQLTSYAGIISYESASNNFSCNDINNFGTLLSFTGACNNSDVKANLLGNSLFGITYNNDAITGSQTENGNHFNGPFLEYAMSHAGDDAIVSESLYKIGGDKIAPYWPSPIFQNYAQNTEWISKSDGKNWDDCKIYEDGGRSSFQELSDLDNKVLNHQLVAKYDAQKWEMEKELYYRLKAENNISAETEKFINSVSASIAAFYEIESKLTNVLKLKNNDLSNLMTFANNFKNNNILMERLVENLEGSLDENSKNIIFNSIQNFKSYNQINNSITIADITYCKSILNSLICKTAYEESWKNVLNIYLDFIQNGSKLDENQIQLLTKIMKGCIQENGNAVFAATTLYHKLFGKVPNFKRPTCSEIDNNESIVDNSFSVQPNPNQGIFNIKSKEIVDGKIEISIFDMVGKLAKQISTTMNGDQISINAAELQSGKYFAKLNFQNKIVPVSFIIIK